MAVNQNARTLANSKIDVHPPKQSVLTIFDPYQVQTLRAMVELGKYMGCGHPSHDNGFWDARNHFSEDRFLLTMNGK